MLSGNRCWTGALDVALAHEAVNVDRRRTTWIADFGSSRLGDGHHVCRHNQEKTV